MKQKIIRISVLVLALLLVSACGDTGGGVNTPAPDNEEFEYSMRIPDFSLEESPGILASIVRVESGFYAVYADMGGGERRADRLYFLDNELNLVRQMDYEPVEEDFTTLWLGAAPDDGYWLLETPIYPDINDIYLTRFDSGGTAIATINLFEEFGTRNISATATDSGGGVYLQGGDAKTSVWRVDIDGEITATWEDAFSSYVTMAVSDNGRVFALESFRTLYELNADGTASQLHTFEGGIGAIHAGLGDTLYYSSYPRLYELALDTMKPE